MLTVDVHHHILPDFFWRETNAEHGPVGGIAPPPWSKDSALAFMDDAGIDVAVTSISTPGVHTGSDRRARSLARRCRELAAQLVQARPGRFGAFACLPLPDVEGSFIELSYALDVLNLDGVVLFSNARRVYLGDERLDPIFAELERRRAVVFVHPTASPDPAAHALGLPDSLLDFVADTSRAIAHLHYSNTFARTPSVQYIFSHAGGTIPYLATRFAIVDEMGVIDVDVDYAVRTATFGAFFHQGQICLNTRRIIVQRKIAGEFLEKFVARTRTLRSGDPRDHRTIIGPLITPAAVKLVDERVQEAIAKGATLHTGGAFEGQIYQPTVLSRVPPDATVANEETFGPVVVVEVVDTPEQGVEAANRTMYGPTSSILAGDTYKAFELAPKILAGIVNVNSPTVNDEIHAPMGGVRDSGWGRTGPDSLKEFEDVIWINSHSGQRQYPF